MQNFTQMLTHVSVEKYKKLKIILIKNEETLKDWVSRKMDEEINSQ